MLTAELISTGTIYRNKAEIPNRMLQFHKKIVEYNIWILERFTLASYMAKKNRVVLLMSAFHHDGNTDRETLIKQKLGMEIFYIKIKAEVDVVNELCSNYDVTQNKKHWVVVVLFDSEQVCHK